MAKKIVVQNIEISIKTSANDNDYLCLTDIARVKNADEPKDVVKNWLRNISTVEFLGLWESINNPEFKGVEFDPLRKQAGRNAFTLSPEKWITLTHAIGITTKRGNAGGTYAHKDIAFEFASWLSPEFKLYLIKEFQRLKEIEKTTVYSLEWQIKRSLSKNNYHIHTDAIKNKLLLAESPDFEKALVYASEADMLNLIVFGQSAKQWRDQNANLAKQGLNIRDMAEIIDLILISNLESLNAHFINSGYNKSKRAKLLWEECVHQKTILIQSQATKQLESIKK